MNWPSIPSVPPQSLTSILPAHNISNEVISLLGAPIGNLSFVTRHMKEKLLQCDNALKMIDDIDVSRTKFHLHRMTASVCRVHQMFRITLPKVSEPIARLFYEFQIRAYSRLKTSRCLPRSHHKYALPFDLVDVVISQ